MGKKRLTHEEFLEKVLQNNKHYANGDFELLELYTGNKNHIMCKCKKCGYEWNAPSNNLLK